jgi:hypothetical protein
MHEVAFGIFNAIIPKAVERCTEALEAFDNEAKIATPPNCN